MLRKPADQGETDTVHDAPGCPDPSAVVEVEAAVFGVLAGPAPERPEALGAEVPGEHAIRARITAPMQPRE